MNDFMNHSANGNWLTNLCQGLLVVWVQLVVRSFLTGRPTLNIMLIMVDRR